MHWVSLQLAETTDAVNVDQAPVLRALWQVLQGTALKSDAERNAVLRQIELTLSETQLTAIQAMRLTNAGALTWLEAQGNTVGDGENQGAQGFQRGTRRKHEMTEEQRAALREQFANMSAEERAAQGARFANGGAASGDCGGGLSAFAACRDCAAGGERQPNP